VEREFDDIAAVVSSLGEPVHLLGHSYGAFCALEAALRSQAIRSLMLYEPGIEVAGEEIYPSATIDRLEALRAAGDRDAMVTTTMREVAGLPPQVVEQLRAQPSWQRGRRGAHHPAGAAGGEGLPGSIRPGSATSGCRRCCWPGGASAAAFGRPLEA
jgi:pimeloyl-ACP methyl ester carboxylesterase